MMERKGIVLAGVVVGLLGAALALLGNPVNMGICVICFLRDTAGALGLHRAAAVQYIRPEIPGFVLGAFVSALLLKELRPRGGSSPAIRFLIATLVSISALVFLGCPLRMVLRLAAGDLNALWGLAGFVAGVFLGVVFLRNGYSLGRSHALAAPNRVIALLLALALLLLLVAKPPFIFSSSTGPGSMRAAVAVSLFAGLLAGFVAQRTRLCTMGGVRDLILIRDYHLISGFAALFGVALGVNIMSGAFNLGFANQPVAHQDALYNLLGMAGADLGSAMLGGCPLRQFILAGEGDQDALITVFGLFFGASAAHNFGLAASASGVPLAGKAAAVAIILVLSAMAYAFGSGAEISAKKSSQEVQAG